MKVYTLALFLVCLNISMYVLSVSGAFPAPLSSSEYKTPSQFGNVFAIPKLDWTTIIPAVGGGIASFLSGVFLNNIFAGAIIGISWVLGCFLTPIAWIVTGVPVYLGDICVGLGIPAAGAAIVQAVVAALFVFIFFIFIMELFSQRYMT